MKKQRIGLLAAGLVLVPMAASATAFHIALHTGRTRGCGPGLVRNLPDSRHRSVNYTDYQF